MDPEISFDQEGNLLVEFSLRCVDCGSYVRSVVKIPKEHFSRLPKEPLNSLRGNKQTKCEKCS